MSEITQEHVERFLSFMEKVADELMYIRESLEKVVEPADKHGHSAIMIHDVYKD